MTNQGLIVFPELKGYKDSEFPIDEYPSKDLTKIVLVRCNKILATFR